MPCGFVVDSGGCPISEARVYITFFIHQAGRLRGPGWLSGMKFTREIQVRNSRMKKGPFGPCLNALQNQKTLQR